MGANLGANTTETAKGMAPIANTPGATKGQTRAIRSAVTNGTRAFVIGDGNSPWARRQRDLLDMYLADKGGADFVSTAMYSLCRLAASLGIEREVMEGKLSLGMPVDLDQFGRIAGHERRVLETIGLKREAKTVMSPMERLEQHRKARREAIIDG
jgi:hypothetical protein